MLSAPQRDQRQRQNQYGVMFQQERNTTLVVPVFPRLSVHDALPPGTGLRRQAVAHTMEIAQAVRPMFLPFPLPLGHKHVDMG